MLQHSKAPPSREIFISVVVYSWSWTMCDCQWTEGGYEWRNDGQTKSDGWTRAGEMDMELAV